MLIGSLRPLASTVPSAGPREMLAVHADSSNLPATVSNPLTA